MCFYQYINLSIQEYSCFPSQSCALSYHDQKFLLFSRKMSSFALRYFMRIPEPGYIDAEYI